MSPRKRRSAVLDADDGEGADAAVDADDGQGADAVSISEAEAAAAEAQTYAEAARNRAKELRRQSRQLSAAERRSRWRARLPAIVKGAAVGTAIVVICAMLTLTGLMMWHHRGVEQQRQRVAEFTAAARQSVVTMMALDPASVRQNMQRVVDNSTGRFKSGLEGGGADEIAKGVEHSKVSTKLTVQSVAVRAIHGDSAEVLVAATSEGMGPDKKQLPPASWRISVRLERDGGKLKTSEFEFVR